MAGRGLALTKPAWMTSGSDAPGSAVPDDESEEASTDEDEPPMPDGGVLKPIGAPVRSR